MAKSLCAKQLLPLSPLLQAAVVGRDDSGWLVKVDGPEQAACPHCSHRSAARHSRYVRTVKDLPAFGAPVSIQLRVNRFRCLNNACAAQYFTAGLPGVAARRGRRTCRADTIVLLVGHALGGRPGERLIGRIGLPVSDDTILRRLKKSRKPAGNDAQVVGLDEWAKRKGSTYGTIVVDLERRLVYLWFT